MPWRVHVRGRQARQHISSPAAPTWWLSNSLSTVSAACKGSCSPPSAQASRGPQVRGLVEGM